MPVEVSLEREANVAATETAEWKAIELEHLRPSSLTRSTGGQETRRSKISARVARGLERTEDAAPELFKGPNDAVIACRTPLTTQIIWNLTLPHMRTSQTAQSRVKERGKGGGQNLRNERKRKDLQGWQ